MSQEFEAKINEIKEAMNGFLEIADTLNNCTKNTALLGRKYTNFLSREFPKFRKLSIANEKK